MSSWIMLKWRFLRFRFPAEHFNKLLGIMSTFSAIASLFQFPLFLWEAASLDNVLYVSWTKFLAIFPLLASIFASFFLPSFYTAFLSYLHFSQLLFFACFFLPKFSQLSFLFILILDSFPFCWGPQFYPTLFFASF